MLTKFPGLSRVSTVRRHFEELLKSSNDGQMLELIGVQFVADEPYILGQVDYDYVSRELHWYDSRSLYVDDIPGGPPPIWKRIASRDGTINSNYGHLMYSQFGQVVDELLRDETSRRAVAVYTRPTIHEDAVANGRDDFICTNTVQYIIRDDQLHVIVNMRSNDVVFGYRNDYAWQNVVQARVRRVLRKKYTDLKLGKIVWQVGSLHIYPRHVPLLEKAISTGDWWIPTK